MIKKLFVFLSIFFLAFGFAGSVQAIDDVNSYELFWPMVAGKLPDESMYQFKILKENLRGVLIFGPVQKSEYKIFIAAKRLLEAEKLLSSSKKDVALKTLNTCLNHLQTVDKKGISADADSRLKNIKELAKYLSSKYSESVDISTVLKKISE